MTNHDNIERLFKAHYAQLHRLAIAVLHDGDTARDIVHDVFESLLSLPDTSTVTIGYLLTAVRNRCLNRLRNLDRQERTSCLYFLDNERYDTEEWPDDETIACIYEIIKSDLSAPCRRVMTLRFVDGLTFTDVAAEMGVSENAVYKHVRHALTIIRKNLSKNG